MTYEYVCTACGHEWEADHAISAPPLKECPSCHEATAKRQVSGGTGFVLKGGGWYSDLYSSTKPAAKDSSDSKSTSSSSTTTSTSSDSSSNSTATAKAAD